MNMAVVIQGINNLRCQAPSDNSHVIATHLCDILFHENNYHLNLFTPLMPDNRGNYNADVIVKIWSEEIICEMLTKTIRVYFVSFNHSTEAVSNFDKRESYLTMAYTGVYKFNHGWPPWLKLNPTRKRHSLSSPLSLQPLYKPQTS